MKRVLVPILGIMICLFFYGCRTTNSSTVRSNNSGKQQSAAAGDKQTGNAKAGKKILVVYFSHTGHTRTIANEIHKSVGGDIFEIKTVVPYPTDYKTLVDMAKKEQETKARPKLVAKVSNIDSYKVIFVGYPNWCGTMPMAVFTFLGQYKLSGKTIVPFCTHGGGGLGQSVTDIRKLCPNSSMLEGLAVQDVMVGGAQKKVSEWLHKIGMTK